MRRSVDYTHRYGRRIVEGLHPDLFTEINDIVKACERGFNQEMLESLLAKYKWQKGSKAEFFKRDLAVYIELTNNEKLYRDMFKLMYLHKENRLSAAIIISPMDTGETKERLKLDTGLTDVRVLLEGDLGSLVTVPIWYIGIE
jgi:Restriction endonuclease BglII